MLLDYNIRELALGCQRMVIEMYNFLNYNILCVIGAWGAGCEKAGGGGEM